MKKPFAAVSVIIGIIMLFTGCVAHSDIKPPMQTQVLDVSIPGSGGVVSGGAKTEYTFTPDNSGIWIFDITIGGDGGLTLDIIYPDGSSVIGTGYDSAFLIEGSTYKVITGVWTYTAGRKNSYTLTVSPAKILPGSGGDFHVDKRIIFSFTPDQTCLWTFLTSNNGASMPYININDLLRGEPGPYNHNGTDDNNAYIVVQLEEGIAYEVEVGFYNQPLGECTLTVAPADSPGNGSEILPAPETMQASTEAKTG
ncbi:MAG: hypothetical protein FWG30_11885 [Eubacteriaceae bacterium]|nr:hypothetical protein [Eubacteriaceae bacterium]